MLVSKSATSTATPTVLVVGFNNYDALPQIYAGRVRFVTNPQFLISALDIPASVGTMVARSGLTKLERDRLLAVSATRKLVFTDNVASMAELTDWLERQFRDTPQSNGTPLEKIRALKFGSTSRNAWVQARLNYPCTVAEEARRLFPEMKLQFTGLKIKDVEFTIHNVLTKAGFGQSRSGRRTAEAVTETKSFLLGR